MAKEIVKYENTVNELRLTNFNSKELDLLMAVCSKMKDKQDETIVYSYDYLMNLVGWDRSQRIRLFHDTIKGVCDKIRQVGITLDISSDEFVSFNLFTSFKGNLKTRELTVRVNPEFDYILNNLTQNFTRFYLSTYTSLKSRYSKLLFQQLEQRKKLRGKFWQISVSDFKYLMDISEGYEIRKIYTQIIVPSIEELKSINTYENLSIKVLHNSSAKGRPITGYRFEW